MSFFLTLCVIVDAVNVQRLGNKIEKNEMGGACSAYG